MDIIAVPLYLRIHAPFAIAVPLAGDDYQPKADGGDFRTCLVIIEDPKQFEIGFEYCGVVG